MSCLIFFIDSEPWVNSVLKRIIDIQNLKDKQHVFALMDAFIKQKFKVLLVVGQKTQRRQKNPEHQQRRINQLDEDEKNALIKIINSMLTKKRMKDLLDGKFKLGT